MLKYMPATLTESFSNEKRTN